MPDPAASATLACRPMRPDEVDAAVRLWHDAWHDAHDPLVPEDLAAERTLAFFHERIATFGNDCFVAVVDGTIRGFGAILGEEIDQFYVDRPSRGTGLAPLFLSVLEGVLKRRKVAVATLHCGEGNTRARRFYEKNGWIDTGPEDWPMTTADGRTVIRPIRVFTKRLG